MAPATLHGAGGAIDDREDRTGARDEGLRIEAPPESAAALADLFESMARLLRESATPTRTP